MGDTYQHGMTASIEKGGVVLVLAIEGEISGMVDLIILKIAKSPSRRGISTGHDEGMDRGSRSENDEWKGEHGVRQGEYM